MHTHIHRHSYIYVRTYVYICMHTRTHTDADEATVAAGARWPTARERAHSHLAHGHRLALPDPIHSDPHIPAHTARQCTGLQSTQQVRARRHAEWIHASAARLRRDVLGGLPADGRRRPSQPMGGQGMTRAAHLTRAPHSTGVP